MFKYFIHISLLLFSFNGFSQNIIWEKLIDYTSSDESINSVDRDSDSTFVFCESTYFKSYFVRAKLNGDTLWRKSKSVNACNNGEFIQHLSCGKIVHFGGKTLSGGLCNFFFEKLDNSGNVLSSWNYGTSGKENLLNGGAALADGGFLGSGMITSNNTYKLSLMRLDSSGNKLWYKTYRNDTYTGSVLVNQKGNYVLYGTSGDGFKPPSAHQYFLEVTPEGDTVRSKYFATIPSHATLIYCK